MTHRISRLFAMRDSLGWINNLYDLPTHEAINEGKSESSSSQSERKFVHIINQIIKVASTVSSLTRKRTKTGKKK